MELLRKWRIKWVEYYLEIVNTVNKGEWISQKDALRALVIVAEHYYESRRFTEALVHFKSIALTRKCLQTASDPHHARFL